MRTNNDLATWFIEVSIMYRDMGNRDLISKRTRIAFREWMTRWTLASIDMEFDSEHFAPDLSFEAPVSGERRRRIEAYYRTIDFGDPVQVRRVLRIFEAVIRSVQYNLESSLDTDEVTAFEHSLKELVELLTADGFRVEGTKIDFVVEPMLPTLTTLADRLELHQAGLLINRIKERIDSDPALAIGSAKELIETACKTILDDLHVAYEVSSDVPQLSKATLKALNLTADQVTGPTNPSPMESKAVEATRVMLQNLATVAGKLAEMRNAVGSGHGASGRIRGPKPRHARLAVTCAEAFVVFVLETYELRLTRKSPSEE